MAGENYPSPPITEAVIEVRFVEPLDEAQMKRVSKKFAKDYPRVKEQQNTQIMVDAAKANVHIDRLPVSYRRSTADEDKILLLSPVSLGVSQLAVYPGWGDFFARFQRDWAIWKAAVGYRKILRIGMRYVNRIDVPLLDNVARHEDYLTIQIQLPEEYPLTLGYSLNARLPLEELKAFANIASGTMESPVPGQAAFLLDIDIVRVVDLPTKDPDIMDLLGAMRDAKNRLFQSFITEAARERFRNDQPLR
jgi:uncharacterized protein (TIGR04255 family)